MIAAVLAAAVFAGSPPAGASAAWRPFWLPPALAGVQLPAVTWERCGESIGCEGAGAVWVAPLSNPVRVLDWRPQLPLEQLVYLHELGHWFAERYLTAQLQARFEGIAGVTGRPWEQLPNSPSDRFAQAFALCALYPRLPAHPFWTLRVYLWAPGPARHRAACAFIRTVGS